MGGVRILTVSPGGWASDALLIPDQATNKMTPVIFVNANEATNMLSQYMTIQHVAFAFYRLKNGGVFQIFNHVEVPELERQFGSPFLVESSYWPEEKGTKDLIEKLITNDELEVCFVAPGNNGPCTGYYGFKILLPEDCRVALKKEWDRFLEYHNSISQSQRNYQQALNQYNSENPSENNPILKNKYSKLSASSKPTSPNKSSSSSGGCYIATATFGSYHHPTVLLYRNFRDNFLDRTFWGKLFIRLYYSISPSVAKIVGRYKFLKYFSCKLLTLFSKLIDRSKNYRK
jgi:hypothetical protein